MKFLTGRTRALPRTLGTLVQSDSKVRLPKENIKAAGPYFEGRRSRREISTSSTNLFNRSHNSWDLKRFLEEVGTDPKEARYWLKQFRDYDGKPDQPFAVIEISPDVFLKPEMLDKLASSLAFLHRNGMPTIIVHGLAAHQFSCRETRGALKANKQHLMEHNMQLVDLLETHGAKVRPFLCSSDVFHAELQPDESGFPYTLGQIDHVNTTPLQWCLSSGHIPILTAVGETLEGQTVCVNPVRATWCIAEALQPMKVIFLNDNGGIQNPESDDVVGEVKIPDDLDKILNNEACSLPVQEQIVEICNNLKVLPRHSTAVITSADSLIAELFTHHGSGTIFKNSEVIHKFSSLQDVDVGRLKDLLVRSFNKDLTVDYFSELEKRLHTIYVTESYSAAAVITLEDGTGDVPYLDKFTVATHSQGLGTSEALWNKICGDFKSLFWRSRSTNRINPWYFVRAQGSLSSGEFIVFWYGIGTDQKLSHSLVEYAASLPVSFDPLGPRDEPKATRVISTSSYHKFL